MTDQPRASAPCTCDQQDTSRWPMAIGSRVFWGRDEATGRPYTLPVVKVVPLYVATSPFHDVMHGFMADLATENGVVVCLTYDPHDSPPDADDLAGLFLYVRHPVTGNLCAAHIEDGQAVYDAWCGDEDGCRFHEHGGWLEWVHSAADVLDRLAHLGRLTIKAIIEEPAHA